jgi:hypothetical protein
MTDPAHPAPPGPRRLLPILVAIGVTTAQLAGAMREYGPGLRDLSTGVVERLCALSLSQLLEDLFTALSGCRFVHVTVNFFGHEVPITQRYFNDFCQSPHLIVDHVDCSGFSPLSLLNAPGAVAYALTNYYHNAGIVGAAFLIVSGVVLARLLWRDLVSTGQRWLRSPPLGSRTLGILLCATGLYAWMLLFTIGMGLGAGLLSGVVVAVASILSSLVAFLLWILVPPAVLLGLLLRPVELWEAWNRLKSAFRDLFSRPE